jgi:hypothetical protein
VVTPIPWATRTTSGMPVSISAFTAGTLSELASASLTVTVPRYQGS